MKRKLITLLKNNRVLYKFYYYLMSSLLWALGLIVSNKHKEILFVCYGGRKYGDNVRPIYERMLKDERFLDWKFIWAFRDEKQFQLPDKKRTVKCRIDSFTFYYYALRSRCWITNVSVQRGLNFKHKSTIYINTWHGVPLKRIGNDIRENESFKAVKPERFDYFFVEGNYDKQIMPSAFLVPEDHVYVTGYPRNDCMFSGNIETRNKIFEKYGLPKDKKLILYAPTYRDYNKDKEGSFMFDLRLNPDTFMEEGLSDDFILMVRAHGAIEDGENVSRGFVDVTDYPDIEDLLVACDVLISDFSGAIFDYSLLGKPIVCFLYDINTYKKKRGFYVDIETFLPFIKCYSERQLYKEIKNMSYEKECKVSRDFVKKCGLIRDGATGHAVDKIASLLI